MVLPRSLKESFTEYRFFIEVSSECGNPRLNEGVEVVPKTTSPRIQPLSDDLLLIEDRDIFGAFDCQFVGSKGLRFAPLGQSILVERERSAQIRGGGLIVPDAVADINQSWTGFVESVSSEVANPGVIPGQRVLFRWSQNLVELGEGSEVSPYYLIIPYKEVLAIVDELVVIDVDNPILNE